MPLLHGRSNAKHRRASESAAESSSGSDGEEERLLRAKYVEEERLLRASYVEYAEEEKADKEMPGGGRASSKYAEEERLVRASYVEEEVKVFTLLEV